MEWDIEGEGIERGKLEKLRLNHMTASLHEVDDLIYIERIMPYSWLGAQITCTGRWELYPLLP